jgi:pseudaminic acid synthase
MSNYIHIGKRVIGAGLPAYIVAELSANHNQSFDQAVKLILAAKEAEVDAVKVQTYTADTMTLKSDKEFFKIKEGTPWSGRTLYDLYQKASMPWEWQPKLKIIAKELGLDFFSTSFDISSLDFLEDMNVPIHKVASFELVDIPLIKAIAQTKKPLFISTGMATFEEISEAVLAAREAGATEIALLKCTSSYPACSNEMNLRAIPYLSKMFEVPVGLSDHSLNPEISIASIALGACIIEKHLTLSRDIPGPDSDFSLEPAELKQLVGDLRLIESSLGSEVCCTQNCEKSSRVFRRSIFVVKDMKAGDLFTADNLRSIRPADGLSPKYLKNCFGKRAAKDIDRGTPLSGELVS